MKKMSELFEKQAGMLGGQFLVVMISVMTLIVVTRSLGLEAFGRVGLVTAAVGVIAIIQQLGIGASFNRQLALTDSKSTQNRLLLEILIFRLIILVPVTMLIFFSSELLMDFVFSRSALFSILRWGMLALVFAELMLILDTFFIAINETRLAIKVSIIVALFRLIIFVAVENLTEHNYFLFMSLSSVFGVTVGLLAFKFQLQRSFTKTSITYLKKTISLIWKMSATSSGTKIVYAFWDRLPILFMANFVGDAVIGQVELAIRLADRFRGIGTSLSKVNLAHMTAKLNSESKIFLNEHFRSNLFLLSSIFGVIVCATYILADTIIAIVGGSQFSGAASYLIYTVTIAYVFLQMNWIGSGILYALDNIKGLAAFHFVSKSLAFSAILFTKQMHDGAISVLIIIALTECISLIYYAKKSAQIGFYPLSGKVLCVYCIVLATLLATVAL
jgi:O-antigen/teichoic acid export membrane protein